MAAGDRRVRRPSAGRPPAPCFGTPGTAGSRACALRPGAAPPIPGQGPPPGPPFPDRHPDRPTVGRTARSKPRRPSVPSVLRRRPRCAAARAAANFSVSYKRPCRRPDFQTAPLAYALFFRARARPVSAHAPCKPRAIGSGRCAPAPFIRQPLPLSTRAYRTQAHRHPPPPAALPACPWPRRRSRQPPRLAPIWRPQARQILSRPPVPMRPVP